MQKMDGLWIGVEHWVTYPIQSRRSGKSTISAWLVSLLYICGVIPTPQSPETPHNVAAPSTDVSASGANVSELSADIVASNGEC